MDWVGKHAQNLFIIKRSLTFFIHHTNRIYVNVNLFYFKMYVSPHCLQLPMLSFLNVIYTSQGSARPFPPNPTFHCPLHSSRRHLGE
ncbi:hypothetical protein ACRRTK_012909 [Alexandromys fortis]